MLGGHFGYTWRERPGADSLDPGAEVDELQYPCEPHLPATHVVSRKLVHGLNSNATRDRARNQAK